MRQRKHRGNKKKGCFGCILTVMILLLCVEVIVAVGVFHGKIKDKLTAYLSPEIPYQKVEIDKEELEQKFYYEQISDEEKTAYMEISQGIRDLEEEIYVHSSDAKRTNKLFELVLKDSPEIFWCDGTAKTTSYEGKDKYTVLKPSYLCDEQERERRQKEIDREVQKCLGGINKNATDYDKILSVFDYIVDTVDYDSDAEDNQNIYSVFVGKKSVCAGYSKATQYLLEKLGVFCTYVTGKTENGENHAWNLVVCEGDYYYLDTTWGDPVFLNEEEAVDKDLFSYDYMCCNDEELFRTHIPDSDVILPECTKMDYNYYVVNGMYYEKNDSELMLDKMNETISKQGNPSLFKFSDSETYEKAKSEIFGTLLEQAAKNLSQWYGLQRVKYTYIDDPKLNKIVIYWKYE
ncbi:MAG: transglutaminase domain-containing protein [Lachnospiraceae bacterium]